MNSTKYIEIFEGERATNYDMYISDFFPEYSYVMTILPEIIKQVTNHVKKPNLLVVGCGTGNEIENIINSNLNCTIDACDPSKEMLTIAQQKFKKQKAVNLYLGTVDTVTKNNHYDLATLFLVLHFLTDDGAKQQLLKNISKRLKKGANFIIHDICGTKTEIRKNFKLASAFFPDSWSQKDITERGKRLTNYLQPISETRFKQLLQESGFTNTIKINQSFLTRTWITTKV